MALSNWGEEDGVHGSKDSIMLGDCYLLGSQIFGKFKVSGEKTEDRGKQPSAVHMFAKMARKQSRLYSAVYGSDHLNERLGAIDRMSDIRDECPEFFTAGLLTETWARMVYQYDACIAEEIHYTIGKYDEGVTFGKVKRYALAPDAKQGAAWRFTHIFDFDSEVGFWRSVVLLEINQERRRKDINSLVAERGKAIPDRRKKETDRVGGDEEKPRAQYPMGGNLSLVERKAGYAHKPLDKYGKTLCYNHSSHDGCNKGDMCQFSHTQRIRPEGLHWTAQYDIARRGGLPSQKRIEAGAVDGYLQALRRQHTLEVRQSIDESKNTGRKVQSRTSCSRCPPGLSVRTEDHSTKSRIGYDELTSDAMLGGNQTKPAQNDTVSKQDCGIESATCSTTWPTNGYPNTWKWNWQRWDERCEIPVSDQAIEQEEQEIGSQTGLVEQCRESSRRSKGEENVGGKTILTLIREEEDDIPDAIQLGKMSRLSSAMRYTGGKPRTSILEWERYRVIF